MPGTSSLRTRVTANAAEWSAAILGARQARADTVHLEAAAGAGADSAMSVEETTIGDQQREDMILRRRMRGRRRIFTRRNMMATSSTRASQTSKLRWIRRASKEPKSFNYKAEL